MNLHKEISFEDEICDYLAGHGWLSASSDASHYDRSRALFPSDLVDWIKDTQPTAWETLTKNHGAAAERTLLDRLRKQLDDRGTLEVLRVGVEMIGLRQPLSLVQFRPALSMNADLVARYQANRLRVVRQLRYSTANENCIDLALFLNGLPVATCELKTDFTQSVQDAVDQYRFDRLPNPKGQSAEPLLSFPSGALVHFAVSNREVQMTTRLAGPATMFLPFNKGDGGGAGNPPNFGGHPTSYLWEEVWQRDSWLEILGRYLITNKNEKKQITSIVFPRYHQLDVTRKLQLAILAEGAGGKFLVQHSAGSGKTNSIAWTAHFLADLHDANNNKVFSTVIVVSDRNVIDTQLQEALFSFQRTLGVVETIKNEGDSKSGQLAQALAGGKKIIVCTIQTFPYALKAVQEEAAAQGKTFAVIADEAHSSQAGSAATSLKQLLSPEELEELADGGEISSEDILVAQMTARASPKGITYVAFTATPNTDIEKRFIFYRRLVPLLEFGRERDELDLSKIVLTHHTLKNDGKRDLRLEGDNPKLNPPSETGSGKVQDKEKVLLAEIISKVNDLFEGELTEDDKLVYVNNVIRGKLLESEALTLQAANNTKEQFAYSPDLNKALEDAIIDAFTAHTAMSRQALGSDQVRQGLKDILLGPAQLYEALRRRAEERAAP